MGLKPQYVSFMASESTGNVSVAAMKKKGLLLILDKMTLETVELPSYSEEIVNLFSRLSNKV